MMPTTIPCRGATKPDAVAMVKAPDRAREALWANSGRRLFDHLKAWIRSEFGSVRPSAFAVLRLMMVVYLST
jgi:hypothetical protein